MRIEFNFLGQLREKRLWKKTAQNQAYPNVRIETFQLLFVISDECCIESLVFIQKSNDK